MPRSSFKVLLFALLLAPAATSHAPVRADEAPAACAAAPEPDKPFIEAVFTVTSPNWQSRPSAQEIRRAFPQAARQAGKTGTARLTCRVSPSCALERCQVASENPAGYGFAAAAMTLIPRFRMEP